MRNNKKKKTAAFSIDEAITPVVNCGIPLWRQRLLLNEMFATAVANAPENETDNFTAKEYKPLFLALSETLENLGNIPQIAMDNQIMLLRD